MAAFSRIAGRSLLALQAALSIALLAWLAGCGQIEGIRGAASSPALARGEQLLQDAVRQRKPPDNAIKEFDRAIAADRNNIDVYLEVMSICVRAGKPDLVAKYGELGNAATSNAPRDKRAAMLRLTGGAYLQLNEPAKAVEFNEPALKLRPDDPGYMNDLGYSYAELYDAKQPGAVTKLQEALNLTRTAVDKARSEGVPDHDLGMFVDSLGWVYFKLEKYDEAAAHLERAADLAPDVKEIHLHLGRARFAQGRIDDARLEAEKALKIQPGYDAAVDLLNTCRKTLSGGADSGNHSGEHAGKDAIMRADTQPSP